MTRSHNGWGRSQPTGLIKVSDSLTGRLERLPAEQRSQMQELISIWDEAYVSKHWELLRPQLDYLSSL